MIRVLAAALVFALSGAPARAEAPLVVLDPGHGGDELGTVSPDGLEEKSVVLAISGVVRARLRQAGIRVRMTRTDDRSLPLTYRPEVANRHRAAAFVSIHLNHAPDPERRGWETYVLSAEASDELTRSVLGREEGQARYRGAAASPPRSALGAILGDLRRSTAHERSARLARSIQDAVEMRPALRPSRGLRQAPFTVLVGSRVPAVLVEVGYLSNPDQARFFATPAGQRTAGRAIAEGLIRFLGRRRRSD